MSGIYDIPVKTIDGRITTLAEFQGRVLLIVNVASQCGLTPQYAGLEELYRKHRDAGFTVLGFPCNQFAHQEPGDEPTIQQFCTTNYGVSFPMMAKVQVNGAEAHPLWQWLKAEAPGLLGSEAVKWNFTKFLVGRDGAVLRRYGPGTKPARIERDLPPLLTAATTSQA